ncbi:MAG: GNAT family N-acetyltransferase [Asgard group archaeon]|nr:GNAT family N-acetyltransferase [Asgard group archaeon]
MLSFGSKLARQKRFVLLENNEIAGALSLEKRNKSIFVYAVGLLERFKRKGYGTYLMKFAENFAKQKGKDFICFSVLIENIPAIKLYEKMKYKSLGIGLTLLRLLMWKFNTVLNKTKLIDAQFYFKPILKINEKQKMCFNLWYEEIGFLAGKKGHFLARNDNLIEFDFKKHWLVYEIYTNNEAVGSLVVIPSNLFQTILLFSHPKLTWNKDWFYNFVKEIYKQKIITHKFSPIVKTDSKQIELSKASVLQIFMTHQHKDNILSLLEDDIGIHDSTEDRQILYKSLS